MATTVELGFDLFLNGGGNVFTLDDATKGVLGGTTYALAGEVLTDVTGDVRQASVSRGRSRTLSQFTAGLAQVTLDNRDRAFDPANASSPYYGSIVPRKQVRISRDGQAIYTGNVESWSWDNGLSGDATAEVRAVDGFAAIAQATVTAGTATGTSPGARIGTVLSGVGWPAAQRALAAGNAVLDLDVIPDGTNALSYVQKVEQSEPGAFFMGKTGLATFLSRGDLQDPTSSGALFGTGGIPIIDYQAASLTDEMRNDVVVKWSDGAGTGGSATASDAASIAAYGLFHDELDTLLDDAAQAQRLADYLVAQYKDPKFRVDSIVVLLEALTTAQRLQVLAIELGDLVTVTVSLPNVAPVGGAVTQLLAVDGIAHEMTPDRHYVTFTMSEATTGFVLDSTSFGVLDTDRLGF